MKIVTSYHHKTDKLLAAGYVVLIFQDFPLAGLQRGNKFNLKYWLPQKKC
ncbi:hypothetical protein LEP1GSC059_2325 [Leptospira noguchii serovar Panama str. CZ214]|uniref:Uncharacterized protein n=1 Tax=Leptospira noguchii serovar Panama str. CZ214 TaxID=1001595 RepID=T0FIF0_9LEPT|nr:hypothetical protein LEP1GSC059_2325 [Leptospira noguchii serovar Panama str. CZ214]